jgi:protein-arginine kinase activator protein McsA
MPTMSSESSPGMEQPCQICGNPARGYVCQIIHGQETNLVLCDVCLRKQSHAVGFPMLDGTQICFYCGGIAASASLNDSREFAIRHQRFHYSCPRCTELQSQFTLEALSPFLDQPPQEQQEQMEDIIRAVAERVRRTIQA